MNDHELRLAYARDLARDRRSRAACPTPEALVALVEKHGSEAERLATLDHVMSCAGCRRDVELLRSIASAGAQLARKERRFNVEWLGKSPWRLASAAVFVLAIGGVATLTLRKDRIVLRGATGPSLVAPSGDVDSNQGLQLTWRRTPDAVRYQVELLSAAGDSLFTSTTPDTTLTLPPIVTLTRGTEYVWLVRAVFGDGTQAAASPLRFRIQP